MTPCYIGMISNGSRGEVPYQDRFGCDTECLREWNRPVEHEFTVKKMEDYANLFFRINDLDTAKAVVELLNSSDAVVATSHVVDGLASFRFLAPNTYYARLFLDANGNAESGIPGLSLTAGNLRRVYYYPRKVAVKENWDVSSHGRYTTCRLTCRSRWT